MTEWITDKQLKKMARIFKITGHTFQDIALSAGIKKIPDHVSELTKEEAKYILKTHSGILIAMEK